MRRASSSRSRSSACWACARRSASTPARLASRAPAASDVASSGATCRGRLRALGWAPPGPAPPRPTPRSAAPPRRSTARASGLRSARARGPRCAQGAGRDGRSPRPRDAPPPWGAADDGRRPRPCTYPPAEPRAGDRRTAARATTGSATAWTAPPGRLAPERRRAPSGPAAGTTTRATAGRPQVAGPRARGTGGALGRHRPEATAARPTPKTTNTAPGEPEAVFDQKSGGVLLSQGDFPQVPSALTGLTSVFGMGTGVTLSLWPPKLVVNRGSTSRTPEQARTNLYQSKPSAD